MGTNTISSVMNIERLKWLYIGIFLFSVSFFLSVFCCHGKWLFCSVMCATMFGSGTTSKGSVVWIFDGSLSTSNMVHELSPMTSKVTDEVWEKNIVQFSLSNDSLMLPFWQFMAIIQTKSEIQQSLNLNVLALLLKANGLKKIAAKKSFST